MAVEANGVNMAKTDGNADRGAPYTLWYSENPNYIGNGTFTPTSNPNSNFYGGTSSNIKITNISASGATMTATVETDEPAPTPTTTPPTTTPIPTPGSGGGGGGGCSALGFAPLGLLLLLPFLALKK
jgi:Synergist-CTERM protein sorting domain-containing protein